MTAALNLFTIPPHRAFADALAAGLIERYGRDPLGLARGVVLLPNNRGVRAVRDAFVRRAEAGLLMPRLVAIGDPELDERLGATLDPAEGGEAPADGIDRLIAAARSPGHAHIVANLGAASDWLIDQAAARGLDIAGMAHCADTSAIRHVIGQHGDEGRERRRGQLAVTEMDLRAIPTVLASPDRVVFGLRNSRGQSQIAYGKIMRDGTTLLIEEVRRSRSALALASMRRFPGTIDATRLAATLDPHVRNASRGVLDIIDVQDISKGVAPGSSAFDSVPPAVGALDRQMILARMVQRARGAAGDAIDAGEAVRLAAELARTLDQLHAEGVDPARLAGAVADAAPELAGHWQASLDVLAPILAAWPDELARRGQVDPARRRALLLERAAARWKADPPAGFVVAAGIGDAAPAVGKLLRTMAGLSEGMVVFAGLDRAMPQAEWDALGPHDADAAAGRTPPSIETHPQFHLKRLLDLIGAGRGEVRTWRRAGGRDAPAARSRAIGIAMAPAGFTGKWADLKPPAQRLAGVRAAEFAGPAEEAQGIAIAIREAVEEPERTVALVTPDRGLARRVVAHLERWGIAADDSAGVPLSATPPGALLLALAEAAAARFAPVALMALLKHPLVRGGGAFDDGARLAWLDGVRALDAALRGPRPGAGLAGVTAHVADRSVAQWWAGTADLLAPLEGAGAGAIAPLLAGLRETAEALAGEAMWAGPAGRAAADLFAGLEAAAPEGPAAARPEALPVLVKALTDASAVRPPQGGHPRVSIWGLIEARLQQADLTILAGLNEGVWPAAPAPDPWLAPAIRRALGLPGLERRIGIAAHDFAMGLGGPQVLVTRARRDARAPAVPSRLWLRLEAMTGGVTRAPLLRRWACALDPAPLRPAYAARPAPSPPVEERPRRIAVTRLDRLKADPFAFYAQAMLRLSPWDALDADPAAAWRGSAVHAVFEAWMKEDRCDPAKLAARTAAMLDGIAAHPVLKALWTPRLAEATAWAGATIAANKAAGRNPIVAEVKGEIEIAGVTLHGKVDRIDRLADGGLAIVDYKTGQPPSRRAVAEGFAMQLGLLGLIAERGGFEGVTGAPAAFEYWSLARGKDGGLGHVAEILPGRDGVGPSPDEMTTLAARQITAAAAHWLTGDAPFTALLHPDHAPYGEYDHLARKEEWYGREG